MIPNVEKGLSSELYTDELLTFLDRDQNGVIYTRTVTVRYKITSNTTRMFEITQFLT